MNDRNDRDALLTTVTDLVIHMDAQGVVIDVDAAASELLRRYPDGGMSYQELVVHIETMGMIVGAALLTGSAERDAA